MTEDAAGVFRLPVYTPYETEPTNAYLLRGERVALFDTGLRHPAAREDLLGGLACLGLKPSDIDVLVVSHAHVDHHGLAEEFAPAEVLVGRRDLRKLVDLPRHLDHYLSVAQSLLVRWDVPAGLRDSVGEAIQGFNDFASSIPGASPVDEGQCLTGFGGDWLVRELPGHTEGLIGLMRESDGVLLSSDHLLPHITPNPGIYAREVPPRSGLSEYARSLQRVLVLAPRVALPGHGHPIADVAPRVAEVLEHHLRRLEVVRELAGGGRTVFQLASELFPGSEPEHVFLAAREIFGHLQILEEEGRVSCRLEGEAQLFAAA